MAFMSQLIPLSDTVLLSKLPFHLSVGLDAWGRRGKPQPVLISLQISHSVEIAAAEDDVSETLDYGKLYKRLTKHLDAFNDEATKSSTAHPVGLQALLEAVDSSVNAPESSTEKPPLTIIIEMPKAALRCLGGLKYSAVRIAPHRDLYASSLEIQKINCSCIVGVNPHERREKQDIYISLEFRARLGTNMDLPNSTFVPWPDMKKILDGGYQTIVKDLSELVGATSYETIEALATFIARYVVMIYGVESVTVSIEKPSAIALIEASGVRVTRTRSFFEKQKLLTG